MGTAAVMLAASLAMLAFMGALVSFGAWPGLSSHEDVDTLLVEAVSTPAAEPLRISTRPQRAATPRVGAPGALQRGATTGTPVVTAPRLTSPSTPSPRVPSSPAPSPAEGGGAGGGGTEPGVVDRTTAEVNHQVETVTEQVGELVGAIGGGLGSTVQGTDKAGGLLR